MNSRSEAPLKTQAKAQESRKTAAAVLGVLASGICAVAAVPPVQNLAAQMADDTPRPRVALTFDDGPHPVYTKRLLDGLQSRGIRATFFVVGENISGSEELIFCAEDRARVGQAVAEQANALLQKAGKAAKLTLSAETRPMCGGVVLKDGLIETNCSIGTMVSGLRPALSGKVAACLFG